jgi:DNA-binding SARP family transcriptional activator
MYEIQLFGRLEVRTRGVRLTGGDFGGDQPRHILALLALRGPLHRHELTELLWNGRPPADQVATVEDYVSVLRHKLDPGTTARDSVITSGDDGYALTADRVRVDVARFDQLLSVAAGRTPSRALPPLTAAAHLADRPLLAEEDPDWATQARELYRGRLLGALLEAGSHALTAGRPREALTLAERALRLDPYAKNGHAVVAMAHSMLGDRVADPALAV